MFEIDHVFVCTAVDAPEAERLKALGLTEGKPNAHPGQGTACRRFCFENAYLELLWVHARAEAQSDQSRPTRLWERWSERAVGACPFGICVRPGKGQPDKLPFRAWDYRPSYLPLPFRISVAANSELMREPMIFYMAFGRRPDDYPADRQQPLKHAAGFREITRVSLSSPNVAGLSPEVQALIDARIVEFRPGDNHYLEVGFDSESRGRRMDFWPALPLAFTW
jgi:hypothetical protein